MSTGTMQSPGTCICGNWSVSTPSRRLWTSICGASTPWSLRVWQTAFPTPMWCSGGHRGIFDVSPEVESRGRDEFMDLCRAAISRGMAIECNLLGMVDGTYSDPSPSWDMLEELAKDGTTMFVGSDAHDTDGFKRSIPLVIEANERLGRAGARFLV